VWSARDSKTIRKTFPTVVEARRWRQESQVALRAGRLRAPSPLTLEQAVTQWIDAAERGLVRTRSGDLYKPSAIRSYRQGLAKNVLPALGSYKLSAIDQQTLQEFADQLAAEGLSPSTIRNALMPLRALYRRATARGVVSINPTTRLDLPAVRGRRDRVARPQEAAALINALPANQQALWATAFYAGLRLGELQALDWVHLNLDRNLIHVERSWDRIAGFIEPKSRAGRRRVPITNTLRTYLQRHLQGQGNDGAGLVFPNTHGNRPFNPSTIRLHSTPRWEADGLQPITLHECRHTYAAFMIAAGINAKALSTYMGHSSITITLDRYGHLLPGNEHEAASLLDQWLGQAGSP
jgi:integrase